MRTVAGCLLVVGLQAAIATGCGSRDESSKDNKQAVLPAVSQAGTDIPASQRGTDIPAERSAHNAQGDGTWVVREEVDPLTDKTKLIGTVAFGSQEQGRYQFELIVDDRVSVDIERQREVPVATVRVSIFDGDPTGVTFEQTIFKKMIAVKEGRYRLDDDAASSFNWVQSAEFANVFSTTIPLDKLRTLKRRLLLTGLRSVDEVFELPRNRSSDALWRTIEQRVTESQLKAFQSMEATAIARKPGPGDRRTRQSLTGLGSIRGGMSKVDVYLAMGRQGPIMATEGAIAEWHYCSTGEEGLDDPDQLATVFFVDGRVVDLARYRARRYRGESGDCTENLKSGDYAEPAAVTALRSKQ